MDAKPDLGAVTLFVESPIVSRDWYAKTLGLPCVYEDSTSAVMSLANTMINLLQQDEAPDMIRPSVTAPANSGVRMQFTIWVASVDHECERLAAIRQPLNNGPIGRPWGQRTITICDPDGYLWEYAQEIDQAQA